MSRLLSLRWSTVILCIVALGWLYPVAWTLVNAVRSSADIYRAPWDIPWPPAIGNLGDAWLRGQLGPAMVNSVYVTVMTVAAVLAVSICAAYCLTWLRPPYRAVFFIAVLAPLIIPTDVVIVPMFSIFRTLGLINSLPGLAAFNVVSYVSLATLVLAGYFRTIHRDTVDAARIDGAGRLDVMLRIIVPIARPGILAVGILVAVFTWNDFGGAVVLIQRPGSFTVQLAMSRFSTVFASDQGLTFAGMAIAIFPPLVLFLLLQRRVFQGLGGGRHQS